MNKCVFSVILLVPVYLWLQPRVADVPMHWVLAGAISFCVISVLGMWLLHRRKNFGRTAASLAKPLANLTGTEFESVVFRLLEERGYQCRHTGQTGDQGVDVIATKSGRSMAVQAKRWQGSVGNKAIQQVFAGMAYHRCNAALVITTSHLTRAARDMATRLNVAYIEGPELQRWVTKSLPRLMRR